MSTYFDITEFSNNYSLNLELKSAAIMEEKSALVSFLGIMLLASPKERSLPSRFSSPTDSFPALPRSATALSTACVLDGQVGTSIGLSRNSISLSRKNETWIIFLKLEKIYKLTGGNVSCQDRLQPDVVPGDELLEAIGREVDGRGVPLPEVSVSYLGVAPQLSDLPDNIYIKGKA